MVEGQKLGEKKKTVSGNGHLAIEESVWKGIKCLC